MCAVSYCSKDQKAIANDDLAYFDYSGMLSLQQNKMISNGNKNTKSFSFLIIISWVKL